MQAHRHWTDEQLLEQLYGLGEPGTGCAECAARLAAVRERQAVVTRAPAGDEDALRAQRQAIWARIEKRNKWNWLGWKAPVSVGALAMLTVVLVETPFAPDAAREVPMAKYETMSDTEFFAEVADVVEGSTARAAAPVQALFIEEDPEAVSQLD